MAANPSYWPKNISEADRHNLQHVLVRAWREAGAPGEAWLRGKIEELLQPAENGALFDGDFSERAVTLLAEVQEHVEPPWPPHPPPFDSPAQAANWFDQMSQRCAKSANRKRYREAAENLKVIGPCLTNTTDETGAVLALVGALERWGVQPETIAAALDEAAG